MSDTCPSLLPGVSSAFSLAFGLPQQSTKDRSVLKSTKIFESVVLKLHHLDCHCLTSTANITLMYVCVCICMN